MSTAERPPTVFRLAAVTGRIRDMLLEVTARRFWVRGQLVARGPARSGHFYGELLDLDELGRTLAKMNLVIWRSSLVGIRRKLELAGTADVLAGNREICVLASVAYHEVHGLSLQVHDVDPSFGEAHIDRNRRLILERLAAEGLLEANGLLELPAAPLAIGLVTAADSAAANDFLRTLAESPYGFRVVLASAAMQGEALEAEVLAALAALSRLPLDLVAIVRGGGSPVDLAWFDNESVARSIATMPMPVWVGIGHEIDSGVPDQVAHSSFKTPTAVAEAIVSTLRGLDDRLVTAAERLDNLVRRPIDLAARSLDRNRQGFLQGLRKAQTLAQSELLGHLARLRAAAWQSTLGRESRLAERATGVRSAAGHRITDCRGRLDRAAEAGSGAAARSIEARVRRLENLAGRLREPRYRQLVTRAETALAGRSARLESLRPERILRRGYSLTLDATGRPISSVEGVAVGETLVTRLSDGRLTSIVSDVTTGAGDGPASSPPQDSPED